MSFFPSDKKKIKGRISRYERDLRMEYEKFHFIRDGHGKRYLLGSMYLLIGDVEGALSSFRWFEENFPNDMGEPFHYLSWTLAFYRSGNLLRAKEKLLQTVISNIHIIPILLGTPQEKLNIYYSSNAEEPEYVLEEMPELFDLWDKEALDWLKETYESKAIQQPRTRYIEIYKELLDVRPGPLRMQLIKEANELRFLKPTNN